MTTGPNEQTCVLLVEDDANIVDLIRSNLVARGFSLIVSRDGSDAVSIVRDQQPDIALLDLMLPRADGFELCRTLRHQSTLGIIVVSARWDESDKVRALNLGADDYLTKPFGVEELLARMHATLRRSRPGPQDSRVATVTIGDVVVDLGAQLVTKAGAPVRLSPTEYALLRELVMHRGSLLSHATLLRRVWGPGYATHTEYTRVYIRRLRAKLESPDGPALIATEPRSGYRLL
jgi:two-component system, OmpR family, KDP operon response regulator KdpE